MPIYVFKCNNCESTQEHIMSMGALDSFNIVCCGEKMELVPGTPGFFVPGKYGKGRTDGGRG